MVTKAQRFLIKKICELQCEALDLVIADPYLKPEHEDMLKTFGVSRKEFDVEIIKTRKLFQKVLENPDDFYNLDYHGFLISMFILNKYLSREYMNRYPNAINNLHRKLESLTSSSEFMN